MKAKTKIDFSIKRNDNYFIKNVTMVGLMTKVNRLNKK